MKNKSWFICPVVFWLLFFAPSLVRAEEPAPPALKTGEMSIAPEFYDVWEDIDGDIDLFEKKVSELDKTQITKEAMKQLDDLYTGHQAEYTKKKRLSSWSRSQTMGFYDELKPFFEEIDRVKKGQSDYIKNADNLVKEITEKKAILEQYKKSIESDSFDSAQRQGVSDYIKKLHDLILRAKKSKYEYTKNQRRYRDLLTNSHALEKSLNDDISYFKSVHFKKTHASFYEPGFYSLINKQLIVESVDIWRLSLKPNWDRLQNRYYEYGWFVVALVALWLLVRRTQRLIGNHLLKQPFGLSALVMMIFAGLYFTNVPNVVVIPYWIVLYFLLYRFIRGLVKDAAYLVEVLTLFGIYAFFETVEALGLPVVLYRLCLTVVSLALVLFVYLVGSKNRRLKGAKGVLNSVLVLFFIGITVLEIIGFHLLSVLFFQGTIKTAVLVFALWNLRAYFIEIIPVLLQLEAFQQIKIISNNFDFIYKKLRFFFHLFLVFFLIVSLLQVWGVFHDFHDACQGVLSFGFTLESFPLTVGRLLAAFVLIYAADFLSYSIQRVLSDEIYPHKNITPGTGKSINTLISYAIWIIVFVFVMMGFGFDLGKLTIIAGALSVGIGFGLQNIVNNFISGLILLFERPIKVGDLLDIDGGWGVVEKVGLRSTIISTFARTHVIIPNSEFVTQKVTNLTLSDTDYRVKFSVGVAYGSDTALVKETLLGVVKKHPMVEAEPEPLVFLTAFGESSLDFEILTWTKDVLNKQTIMSDLLLEIDREFRQKNIEVPFPQRDLHVRSVDASVVASIKKM
ncbi:MAG: mechanosensitive ion channel [Deltaproteobacteria bacterium]|nr:mechanosensitive ion channel [Deltaproteobacteria bacterium]